MAGPGRVSSSLGERMAGMPARHQLDGHVRDDVPRTSQVARHARAVRAAVDFEEPLARFEDALFRHISLLRRESGVHPQQRREPGVILTGHARVCCGHEPTHRRRGQGNGLGHANRVEPQQPPGSDGTSKDRHDTAVKAPVA